MQHIIIHFQTTVRPLYLVPECDAIEFPEATTQKKNTLSCRGGKCYVCRLKNIFACVLCIRKLWILLNKTRAAHSRGGLIYMDVTLRIPIGLIFARRHKKWHTRGAFTGNSISGIFIY